MKITLTRKELATLMAAVEDGVENQKSLWDAWVERYGVREPRETPNSRRAWRQVLAYRKLRDKLKAVWVGGGSGA